MTGLRVCMVTTFYPPYSFGGDAVAIQRLARGLVRRGHQVTVLHDLDAFRLLRQGPVPETEPEDDGVETFPLESVVRGLSPLLTQQFGRPVVNGRRIRSFLQRGEFDVVNFHNVSLIGGPGILRLAGDAVTLFTAHDHWLICPTHVLWRHEREPCMERQCLRCVLRHRRPPQLWRSTGLLERDIMAVDAVIAMSEFSRRKHREFGLARDMEVLPSFLPDDGEGLSTTGDEPSPSPRPYFFFAGRLERIKGLDDVIPVFRSYPDADLIIAGTGHHVERLRELSAGMSNVRFLGQLAAVELRRYYRHAIGTLVPSVCFETFGIVIIESLREGTPVIARNLGPFPELIAASGGGLLFDTAEELAKCIRRLQCDEALRASLSANGLKASRELWSESAVIPRYLDIVRRAAERRSLTRVLEALPAGAR